MTVHGSARFATLQDMVEKDLVESSPLGDDPFVHTNDGVLVGWTWQSRTDYRRIRYDGDLHQLIVAGTGGGKFTTALAPMLIGSCLNLQTCIVIDPKGELARLAGPIFQHPFMQRPRVFLLDPWDECKTGQTQSFNVLDELTEDNPRCVDDARALADALVIPSGSENTHWDNAARNFLTALLLYVALHPSEKDKRDLTRVRDLITTPWSLPKTYAGPPRTTLSSLLPKLLDTNLADGAIKRGFSSILNREDKERSGIISSVERDTAWIDSPQMRAVLKKSSFEMKEVSSGTSKFFVVIPFDYLETHRGWLRLMVIAFAKALRKYPDPGERKGPYRWRHIIIDEFATLGEMAFVRNDIAVSRGYNVKYHLAIQDLSQLRRVYGESWESFISNSFQRFFAVSDLFTADYVSRMLGVTTVDSESRSASQNTSQNEGVSQGASKGEGATTPTLAQPPGRSFNKGESLSYSQGSSSGWSETISISKVQRPLMTPDEVRRLAEFRQLLFFRGMHAVECWRPPYFFAFHDLPKFSLREVLETIGREPRDDDEKEYFERHWWLMHPKYLPIGEEPKPAVEVIEVENQLTFRDKARFAAGALVLFFLLYVALEVVTFFWPNPQAVSWFEFLRGKKGEPSATTETVAVPLQPNPILRHPTDAGTAKPVAAQPMSEPKKNGEEPILPKMDLSTTTEQTRRSGPDPGLALQGTSEGAVISGSGSGSFLSAAPIDGEKRNNESSSLAITKSEAEELLALQKGSPTSVGQPSPSESIPTPPPVEVAPQVPNNGFIPSMVWEQLNYEAMRPAVPPAADPKSSPSPLGQQSGLPAQEPSVLPKLEPGSAAGPATKGAPAENVKKRMMRPL